MKIQIVDEKDNVIGIKERNNRNENDIVRVSGLFVFNQSKEILIAKRAMNKVFNPGKWSVSVAGGVEENETYLSSVIRETEEEIGIKITDSDLVLGSYNFVKTKHRCFRQMYYVKIDLPVFKFKIQNEEVDDLKWVTIEELRKWVNSNPSDFTDSFPQLLTEFIDFLNNTNQ